MASTSQAFINSFFFVLIISLSLQIVAGRNIPADPHVQAELAGYDGTVLVPGLGRYMVPKKGQNPLHYNPITGAPGGSGIPQVSMGGGSYLPGGDDTYIPNPNAVVPSPLSGGVPQH